MARAAVAAKVSSVCKVARVGLEKLMVRPVACAKFCRIVLSVAVAEGEAAAMISVSSAYWRTLGGR